MDEIILIITELINDLAEKVKRHGVVKSIIIASIILSLFGGLLEVLLDSAFPLLVILGFVFLGKYGKKKGNIERNRNNTFERDDYRSNGDYHPKYASGYEASKKSAKASNVETKVLPKDQKKRKKIIEEFNEKYDLCLKQDEIDSILASSYFSNEWQHEVEAMTARYDSVYDWISGSRKLLRLYLWGFLPQEITSDITQQRKICVGSFDLIFKYAETLGNIPRSEMIEKVNEKYFCQLDDITFTMALKEMKKWGYEYELGVAAPVQMGDHESELDQLEKKYADMGVGAEG